MQFKTFGLAAVAVLAVVLPASAHHSHANYEAIKWQDIKGKVTELQWLNPHVWVYVDVKKANGEMEQWALEAPEAVWPLHTQPGGSPLIRGDVIQPASARAR